MPKRKNIMCMMRDFGMKPNNGGVARCEQTDKIHIFWREPDASITDHISGLSTRDARLLAKRINQFLDAGG